MELHNELKKLLNYDFEQVINIGCPEGYYAVGLAMNLPKAEIHAFDISGDNSTYCCPEVAKELSQKLSIDVDLLNGNYPTKQEDRDLIINNTRALFDND